MRNNVDDYDYEDYSYNHFFQKTFLPQIRDDKTKLKSSHNSDKNSKKKYSDIGERVLTDKSENLPRTFKLEDNREKSSTVKNDRIEKRRYDQLEVIDCLKFN